jgi:hypothetical protein
MVRKGSAASRTARRYFGGRLADGRNTQVLRETIRMLGSESYHQRASLGRRRNQTELNDVAGLVFELHR